MKSVEIFKNGHSQAVRLSVDFRFNAAEVYIHKVGSAVTLVPKSAPWQNLKDALSMFSDDFFDDPRDGDKHQIRKAI